MFFVRNKWTILVSIVLFTAFVVMNVVILTVQFIPIAVEKPNAGFVILCVSHIFVLSLIVAIFVGDVQKQYYFRKLRRVVEANFSVRSRYEQRAKDGTAYIVSGVIQGYTIQQTSPDQKTSRLYHVSNMHVSAEEQTTETVIMTTSEGLAGRPVAKFRPLHQFNIRTTLKRLARDLNVPVLQ